ncbi:MAG: hypothetical protein ACK56I_33435, partial [bacterium]
PCIRQQLVGRVSLKLLPSDRQADEKGNFKRTPRVVSLTPATDASCKCGNDRMPIGQSIPTPSQHLADQFRFLPRPDIRREQEIDGQSLGCQAFHGLRLIPELILELLTE